MKVWYENMEEFMKGCHRTIFYSGEDEGCIAGAPDLEACSAFGETPVRASRKSKRAKSLASARTPDEKADSCPEAPARNL